MYKYECHFRTWWREMVSKCWFKDTVLISKTKAGFLSFRWAHLWKWLTTNCLWFWNNLRLISNLSHTECAEFIRTKWPPTVICKLTVMCTCIVKIARNSNLQSLADLEVRIFTHVPIHVFLKLNFTQVLTFQFVLYICICIYLVHIIYTSFIVRVFVNMYDFLYVFTVNHCSISDPQVLKRFYLMASEQL